MSNRYVIEALLRPAVELNTAVVSFVAALISLTAPWAVALHPTVSLPVAAGFGVFGGIRAYQGITILRYRRNLRRLPRYALRARDIPVSRQFLFLGRGFQWTQKHTQRLLESRNPHAAHYLRLSQAYVFARWLERRFGQHVPWLSELLRADTVINPVRPLPAVGGNPVLHGVEPDEKPVLLDIRERVGHTLVLGTTRVGKTRLAEVLITQDIHRGDVTIVFDPKGDADLLKRVWAESRRAGRAEELTIFHLGWPELSARYNAIGRFGRVSEVASRLSGQLSREGNSAAFREFAWRFVNIIARTLVALGERPNYQLIMRHVNNIGELYQQYARKVMTDNYPLLLQQIQSSLSVLNERDIPRNLQGLPDAAAIWATELALSSEQGKALYDPVLDGLRSAIRYDRTYFDKIVASLLPLLEKLTTGKTAELLSPDYLDMEDSRPVFDWEQVIRKRGIVYIGLDALSDADVAQAVGNSMFADLVSVAGHIYKHGIGSGLPGNTAPVPINLHCDEFNELMGDEFIPLINKGGGAGIQVTAYTQTASDIEARVGSQAKTAQVTGNFNTLIMLRVRENRTAELLTSQLPEVEVATKTLVSGHSDTADIDSPQVFTSSTQDRVSAVKTPMLTPADIVSLPKGQAFALMEGGRLYKLRLPLPREEKNDPLMPASLMALAQQMQSQAVSGENWCQLSTLASSEQDNGAACG